MPQAELKAGGKDKGAPGLRPNDPANHHAAVVLGPGGHKLEVVCHQPEA